MILQMAVLGLRYLDSKAECPLIDLLCFTDALCSVQPALPAELQDGTGLAFG